MVELETKEVVVVTVEMEVMVVAVEDLVAAEAVE